MNIDFNFDENIIIVQTRIFIYGSLRVIDSQLVSNILLITQAKVTNINYIKRYQIIKYPNDKNLIKDFDTSNNNFVIFTKKNIKN